MSSSRLDTAAATKRVMDSYENRIKFIWAREATTYDNLLSDGSISNADVRDGGGWSGIHYIPQIGFYDKDIDIDILLSYLLTCDPPADVNGRNWSDTGVAPMWRAADYNNTSAVKVLIEFSGDRTIKSKNSARYDPNTTPLDVAKKHKNQEIITMLTDCFPSEE
jgi:hypothetical protein